MKKLFNVRNIPIIAALFVILLSIAYSAFGTNLNIGGIAANVRIEADIRVTGISVDSYTNAAISSYEEYNVSNISMGANLPNSNSTITYKVDVTNFGNVEMGIFAINNLPSNLEYELSGYTLQDKLCNNNQCSLGIKKEFYITIKYKDGGYNASNTTYALNLDFDFRSFYTVTYEDFSSTISYPKEIISGGDLAINFTELVPDIEVKVGNLILDQDSYTFDQYNLYLSNVTNNVVVKYISYPPTIVFNLVDSSVINSNGWAKENFYLQATVTDNSSKGIKEAKSCTSSNGTACTPNASFTDTTKSFYITTEGNNMACVTVTDNNDRTTTACSDIYNLDKTAPTAGTATFTGTLGSNSWYTTNVGVNVVNGSDSLSGHSSTVSNVTSITSNTTGTTVRITTTDLAGNTATRDYTIKIDKNSPTISAKYDSVEVYYGDSNVVSNYFNSSFSISGGVVNCSPTNTSSLTTGTHTATCTATGGNGKVAVASLSVSVIVKVPPDIVFNLVDSSAINSNGWAKENFYLQAIITDNSGKGIKEAKSCTSSDGIECTPNATFTDTTKSFYITTEGGNMACVTATDNNDMTTTACSDVYNLDKTAPTAGTATFTGTLGSNSWYTTNVTVNVKNGSDSLSGHSSTVSNVASITSNTTGTTVRITTTDLAGNTASRDYTIKVDKNSPTISAKSSSVEVYYGDSNVVSNYFNTSYSTSGGSVSCSPTNTNEYSLAEAYETFTATCTATGGNGKTASSSISIRVIAKNLYTFFIVNSVPDNTSSTFVSSSTGINFSSAASSTNGLGYYYSSTNGIYYARGGVTNNNVLFANACWKMVRTDGSGVKLIYNGTSSIANPDGICDNSGTSSQIGTSAFNSVGSDNAYVGYMYGAPETSTVYGDVNGSGTVTQTDYLLIQRYVNGTATPTEEQKILADVNLDGSLTSEDYEIVKNYVLGSITSIIDQNTDTARYNATHKNRTNSTIKSTIDSWYASKMTSYTSKLKDAIWCNDRSKSSSYLGYGNWTTYYAAYNRSSSPSLTCTNTNDRFTVSTSNGNGALTYPVGLLTYDEWILAGRTVGYLNSGSTWWTMTPRNYQANAAGSTTYNYTSSSSSSVTTSYGVRPSIVLSSTSFTSGTGTVGDPFVVS